MTIRTRLTLLFAAVVSTLLLLFFSIIYVVAEQYRQTEYYERLRAEAFASAELLFGKQTISPKLFKLLDKNHMTVLNDEEIIIYNYLNKLEYESGTDYLSVDKATLDRVRLEKEVKWRQGNREIVGVLFTDRYNHLVVFASAVDKYGFRKQRNLGLVLAGAWLLATLVVLWVGWIYAGRALAPTKRLVKRVDEITASRLNLRVEVPNQKDEIGQLAARFNQMLDRLEEAFHTQKAFVSNASHELRTPLTAIRGQIQVALMDDDPAEWKQTLESVLEDTQNLTQLSNGLLTLANINVEGNTIALAAVSLRKIAEETRRELRKAHPDYVVNFPPNPAPETLLNGSEALLRILVLNLMENGCKYSPDHTVNITLTENKNGQQMAFQNGGLPIPAEELPHIFKPFKRGTNSLKTSGHGIGLSLAERIVRLHRGTLLVDSETDRGTTFTVELPNKF